MRGNRLRRARAPREPIAFGAIARRLAGGARRGLVAAAPFLITATIIFGMGAVGYGAFVWLTTADRFAIDDIAVRGNVRLSRQDIVAKLGIAPGDNVFLIDPEAATMRLSELSWVASASVRRELPDRVVVTVEENKAAAMVDLGKLYLVDSDGRAFKRLDTATAESEDLVVITGIGRKRYRTHPAGARAAIIRALAIKRAWDTEPRPRLGEIHVDPIRGITLFTYDRALAISLGHADPDELARRMALYDRAWAALGPEEKRRAQAVRIARSDDGGRVVLSFSEARTPN